MLVTNLTGAYYRLDTDLGLEPNSTLTVTDAAWANAELRANVSGLLRRGAIGIDTPPDGWYVDADNSIAEDDRDTEALATVNDLLELIFRSAATYAVYRDGAKWYARSGASGTIATSNSDPAVVVNYVLHLASTIANGATTIISGRPTWGSVPSFAPGYQRRVVVRGLGDTTVKMSTSGPRLLDFGKTADYDAFDNWEIRDLTVDCDNVGGRHHVVIGTYINGTPQTRVSGNNWVVDNVRTINVPSDSTLTNHRLNVWICPGTPAGSTAMHWTNGKVTNVRFEGGNQGIVVAAADVAAGANCFVDEVHIDRWWHSRGSVWNGPLAFSSSNVQIGSRATVGRVSITNGYGEFSGDVGIELDSAQNATIRNVKIVDAFNIAFLLVNFVTPPNVAAQEWVLTECVGKRVTSSGGVGFRIDNNGGGPFGNIVLNDCEWHHTQGGVASSGADGILLTQTVDFHSITVNGFDYVRENLNYTSATNANVDCIAFNGVSTTRSPHLTLRDIRIRISGTRDAGTAGSLQVNGIELAGSTYSFDVENPYFDMQIANMSVNGMRLIEIGRESSNLRGTIRGIRLGTISDDTGPRGILVRGTGTLTIPNEILVEDCDFVRMPAGVAEFAFVTPTNAARIRASGIKWRTAYPRASAALGTLNFVSGSWTTATGNQYIGLVDAEVHFANATGAGITKIESSKDGTTYEANWEQSSGAMAQDVLVPVENGDYVRVTFATTQPVTRVRFRR